MVSRNVIGIISQYLESDQSFTRFSEDSSENLIRSDILYVSVDTDDESGIVKFHVYTGSYDLEKYGWCRGCYPGRFLGVATDEKGQPREVVCICAACLRIWQKDGSVLSKLGQPGLIEFHWENGIPVPETICSALAMLDLSYFTFYPTDKLPPSIKIVKESIIFPDGKL